MFDPRFRPARTFEDGRPMFHESSPVPVPPARFAAEMEALQWGGTFFKK